MNRNSEHKQVNWWILHDLDKESWMTMGMYVIQMGPLIF